MSAVMDNSVPLPPSVADSVTTGTPSPMKQNKNALMDALFKNLTRLFAFLVFILLAAILVSLIYGSRESLAKYGLSFLWLNDWDPVKQNYGAVVPIIGTLLTSAIALIIAVPVSFGIAIFLTELSPTWLRRPLGTAVEMLAAIPSIIYGMWGLFVFGPFMAQHIAPWINDYLGALPLIGGLFQGPPLGIGMLSAGIVLAIMIIPFITSVMNEVFNSVPTTLKESAYALGNTTWEVVWDIVLPYTRSAVVGGIFLGLGRALGETMAVTFVLGNSQHFSASLLMPSSSIASVIANEFNEAYTDLHRSALIALGFLLFVVTFVVLAAARLMLLRLAKKEGK